MRDTKSLSLLLLSSVLFLLSIILLCTWGYQYYHQIQEDKGKTTVAKATPPAASDAARDSLLKIYKVTLNALDSRMDTAWNYADSLKGNLDINLKEFYQLRDEIAALLQAKVPNAGDLILARKKIGELQQKVEQLRYTNSDVEKENKRLKAILEKMARETGGIERNSIQVERENKNLTDKLSAITTISTVNLNLAALANNDQEETSAAEQTEKLVGSFTVKNTGNNYSKCDIMIVVVQPDGQVLQKSAWESGSFETNEGKKIYSCKVRCETAKGESKKLNFSLTADNYQKGNYSMRIYHNGVMIGKMSKTLS
jgi:chromosome segregation ATPase